VHIQGDAVEIQTPTHWNLIGSSMTAPAACVIAQQYSSATFILLVFHSRKEKFGALFSKVIISIFFTF
jgi:hypothetical protein